MTEKLETSKILEATKEQLQKSLHGHWRELYWEPHRKNLSGEEEKSFCFQESKDKKTLIIVLPDGRLIEEKEGEKKQLNVGEYIAFAPKAETALKALEESQFEEIINNPEGKDILWWPGQVRFGEWQCEWNPYGDFSRETYPTTVRAKKDGLYCPKHPDQKLVHTSTPNPEKQFFFVCPDKECDYSVYNGT